MNPEALTQLKQDLTAAEEALVKRIEERQPTLEVPEHILVARMLRLEEEQLVLESDFRRVRVWLDKLAQ